MFKSKLLAALLAAGFVGIAAAAPPAFEEVDRNGDGSISRQEAGVIEGLDFATADANHDGKLSKAEYDAATSKM